MSFYDYTFGRCIPPQDYVLKWAWPACGGCAFSYLWNAGKAGSVLKWAWPACGGCGWSYLWKAGKAGLCSEVGVACLWWVCVTWLWWVWLVLPVERKQGWTLF